MKTLPLLFTETAVAFTSPSSRFRSGVATVRHDDLAAGTVQARSSFAARSQIRRFVRPAPPSRLGTTSPVVEPRPIGVRPHRPGIHYQPFRDQTTRTIVLQGVNNKLSVGDHVLVVENEHTRDESATPYQLSSVIVDKTNNTTVVTWQEVAGRIYDASSAPIVLYALRVKAGAFGNTAPNWFALSPTLTNSDQKHGSDNPQPIPYPANWDDPDPNAAAPYLPRQSINTLLALDAVYDGVKATTDNPGWVVLMSGDGFTKLPLRFIDAQPVTLTDYALNTKVTQLKLSSFNPIPDTIFGIRDTLILTGGEALTLHNNLPIPDPLQGDTLVLQGLFQNLQDGQAVIITGDLFGSDDDSNPVVGAELRLLDGPPQLDVTNNLTTVRFRQPLANDYVRASTTMLANVVAVTQGETVKDEVLGSGDGSALQFYALNKSPLTYLPSTDPTAVAPVTSAAPRHR